MSVAERKPEVERRERQCIEVRRHVWAEVRRDAEAYGLSPGAFLLLNWMNWRSERRPLSLIPELPVDPYRRS